MSTRIMTWELYKTAPKSGLYPFTKIKNRRINLRFTMGYAPSKLNKGSGLEPNEERTSPRPISTA